MKRFVAVAVLVAAAGCSNAPLAGSLDAIWPARGGPSGDAKGNGDRASIVPDVGPAAPNPRPQPGPPATDALPPPADFVPGR